jgi:hypothetical protein
MLFNSLQAFSELPGQMQGRPILYSQAAKKFYRPGALSVAQTIADCESLSLPWVVGVLTLTWHTW